MTKLSRRGFLFGTTALVAAGSMPAPATRILAGPAGGGMTATSPPTWWLEEAAPVLERALHDVMMFGRGAVRITGDGHVRHVLLDLERRDELDRIQPSP